MTNSKQRSLHPLAERLLPSIARGEAELATIATELGRVSQQDVAWAVTSLLGIAVAVPAASRLLIAACATQAVRLRQGIDRHQLHKEALTRDAQSKLRRFQQDVLPQPQLSIPSKGRSLGQLLQERRVQDVRAMAVSRASWVR